MSLTPNIIDNYRTMMNFSEKDTKTRVKKKLLSSLGDTSPADRETIRDVAKLFEIKGRNIEQVASKVIMKIQNDATPPFQHLLKTLRDETGVIHGHRIIKLLYKIVHPDNYSEKAIMKIDKKEYEELLAKKKTERDGPATLKADKQKRLEAALLTKVCKCVKDQYLRHKFRYEILGIYPEAIPPEALCQASIYNHRGLEG